MDVDSLERNLVLLKTLSQAGFIMKCEEGGGFSGEIQVSPRDLDSEIERLNSLLADYSESSEK